MFSIIDKWISFKKASSSKGKQARENTQRTFVRALTGIVGGRKLAGTPEMGPYRKWHLKWTQKKTLAEHRKPHQSEHELKRRVMKDATLLLKCPYFLQYLVRASVSGLLYPAPSHSQQINGIAWWVWVEASRSGLCERSPEVTCLLWHRVPLWEYFPQINKQVLIVRDEAIITVISVTIKACSKFLAHVFKQMDLHNSVFM